MTLRQYPEHWALGHEHGLKGRPSQCPVDADPLTYASGYVEGRAERDRGIAGGIGLRPDGSLNVVNEDTPKFEPTILPDEDDSP